MSDITNPEVANQASLTSHLSGLVPKAVLDSAPGRFVTAAFDNSSIGAKANLGSEYWHSLTSPAKEPGGNLINDLATSLWKAHVAEFNKAGDYSTAAQHSSSLGEWAGNTSQSLGHLTAAALPLVGPAAANAGERMGTGDIAGGAGAGAGLIASSLLGGAATSKAGKALGLTDEAAAKVGKVVGSASKPNNAVQLDKPKIEPIYKATTVPGTASHQHTVEVHLPGEKESVGNVKAAEEADRPGSWRVQSSDMHPDLQGQGFDKGSYERLIQHAKENGAHEIHSGGVVSPEEAKVWESLSKKYPVDRISTKEGNTYRLKIDNVPPSIIKSASAPPPTMRGAAKVLSIPSPPDAMPEPTGFDRALAKATEWADSKMTQHMAGKPNTVGRFADAVEKHIVRPQEVPLTRATGVYENDGAGIHLVRK